MSSNYTYIAEPEREPSGVTNPNVEQTVPPSHITAIPKAQAPNYNPLNLRPIATHPTSWRPAEVRVALNVTLDACIVPDAAGAGARVDRAHLVVLDNLFGEPERLGLLDFITQPGWEPHMPPPPGKWSRSTRDSASAAPTWGLRGEWLSRLATTPLAARLEIQSRLQLLYPDYVIAHMPSDKIQIQDRIQDDLVGQFQEQAEIQIQPKVETDENENKNGNDVDNVDNEDGADVTEPKGGNVDCNQFVANAAMHNDTYSWHVDADPSNLPYPSPWTLAYGQYVNREPGRPLFVSLLLYLNRDWDWDWHAETLFLDTPSDCGVVVRPKAYRAVLLDQDVLHRLVPPSQAAQGRPRYSLVWKLVLLPRHPGQQATLARRAWGRPTPFGSAATLERVVSGLAAARTAAEKLQGARSTAEVGTAAEAGVAEPIGIAARTAPEAEAEAEVEAEAIRKGKRRRKRKQGRSEAAAADNQLSSGGGVVAAAAKGTITLPDATGPPTVVGEDGGGGGGGDGGAVAMSPAPKLSGRKDNSRCMRRRRAAQGRKRKKAKMAMEEGGGGGGGDGDVKAATATEVKVEVGMGKYNDVLDDGRSSGPASNIMTAVAVAGSGAATAGASERAEAPRTERGAAGNSTGRGKTTTGTPQQGGLPGSGPGSGSGPGPGPGSGTGPGSGSGPGPGPAALDVSAAVRIAAKRRRRRQRRQKAAMRSGDRAAATATAAPEEVAHDNNNCDDDGDVHLEEAAATDMGNGEVAAEAAVDEQEATITMAIDGYAG